jgi:transposase-like protein
MNTYNSYTDSLRREIVGLVATGQFTKEQARRHYGIKGHSTIMNWIRKFEGRQPEVTMTKDYKKSDKATLIKRIRELERKFEDEQLRSEGLSKMIDIAEEQLNIPIRKKSTTKRSRR